MTPDRDTAVYPDFIVAVRDKDGKETMWVAETEGKMRTNMPLKNESAELWCEKMSVTKSRRWRYLFAQQLKFENALRGSAATFAELVSLLTD